MSNDGPQGTNPAGAFTRTCQACGAAFRTDWPRQRYCSNACKRRAQNARHYRKHRERITARVKKHQKGDT